MSEKAFERGTSGKLVVGVIAVVVTIAVAVVLIFRTSGEGDDAWVEDVDPERRAQLFAREYETFRELCGGERPTESPGNCTEAARLLEQFPECEAECRQAIERSRQRMGTTPPPAEQR